MQDIITYVQNFGVNLPPLQNLIFIIAALVGLFTVIISLASQFSSGRKGEGVLPSTLGGLIVGSLLFSLPKVVDIVGYSMFGSVADPQIISSFTSVSGSAPRKALQVLVALINLLGWIAVARGLWRWRMGPKIGQPGWFGQGLTFVIAGVLAINFYVLADILAVSVGAIPAGTTYFKF